MDCWHRADEDTAEECEALRRTYRLVRRIAADIRQREQGTSANAPETRQDGPGRAEGPDPVSECRDR